MLKRTLFAILGIAVFSAVSLRIYIAISVDEEPELVAIVATTLIPTTTEPTTTTSTTVATTTTSPLTTTTVPPSTTTEAPWVAKEAIPDPLPEPKFRWKNKAALLGVLVKSKTREYTYKGIEYSDTTAFVSGIVLRTYEEIDTAGEPVYKMTLYFGNDSTGEPKIGEFLIGNSDSPSVSRFLSLSPLGLTVYDPISPANSKGTTVSAEEMANRYLIIGEQYPFELLIDYRPGEGGLEASEAIIEMMAYSAQFVEYLIGKKDVPVGLGLVNSFHFTGGLIELIED